MGLRLHQLAHYKGIADALALIFAQLSAFVVHVSTAVGQQETCHCDTHWAPKRGRKGASINSNSNSSSAARPRPPQLHKVAGAAPLGRPPPQRPSPFATAAVGAVGAGPDADGASVGLSTLLSGMERQGSGVSSYLWEKKTGWGQAREMLKRELDASLGHYVSGCGGVLAGGVGARSCVCVWRLLGLAACCSAACASLVRCSAVSYRRC
jgi:hypothetical protein